MPERKRIRDLKGRVWTLSKVRLSEAADEDFRFWYEELSPEERVRAVGDAVQDWLKARGQVGVPRLRRVHRRIQRA